MLQLSEEKFEVPDFEGYLPSRNVIGFSVTSLSFGDQVNLILQWAKSNLSKMVCIANVHMLIEAHQNPQFASVLQKADLVTPDGMPLVWMLRWLGVRRQERVAGPDVMRSLCYLAAQEGVSLFFLGSHLGVLEPMKKQLQHEFPALTIAGIEPLPFRRMTATEDEAIVKMINDSGAGVVLVSLGCPKQEAWMAQHKDRVKAVMVGVGGAFPVYAGIHKRAPQFVQNAGLEWLYRFVQEPQRLWGRYSSTIPLFIYLAVRQLLSSRHRKIAYKGWTMQ